MNVESTIMNTRTSPENLASVYQKGMATVLLLDDSVIGFIAAWPVAAGFVEVGSAWIHKDYRGKGYGNQLYDAVNTLPGMNGAIGFAITQNPIALHAGERAGLKQHKDWYKPVPWSLTCTTCSWMKSDEINSCQHRNKTCWLRIRKP